MTPTKFKPLNSTQKTALGWAKARGGKIVRYSRDSWKPGVDRSEIRVVGHNTVVSLLRRGLVKESAWNGRTVTEVEIVPDGQAIVPESIGMTMHAHMTTIYAKRS